MSMLTRYTEHVDETRQDPSLRIPAPVAQQFGKGQIHELLGCPQPAGPRAGVGESIGLSRPRSPPINDTYNSDTKGTKA